MKGIKFSQEQINCSYNLSASSVQGFIEAYEEGSIMLPPHYGAECTRLYKRCKKAINGRDIFAKRLTVIWNLADEIDEFESRIDIFN
jgi:hypothetical protein